MSYKIPKRNISKSIRKNKIVTDYDEDELEYLSKPLGKAAFEYEDSSSEEMEDNIDVEDDSDSDSEHGSESHGSESYEYYYSDDEETPQIQSSAIQVTNEESSESESGEVTYQEKPKSPPLRKKKVAEDKPTPKKKAHWSDRLKCEICGGTYTRSAVSAHRGTKKHQIYAKTNKKLLNLMRD